MMGQEKKGEIIIQKTLLRMEEVKNGGVGGTWRGKGSHSVYHKKLLIDTGSDGWKCNGAGKEGREYHAKETT